MATSVPIKYKKIWAHVYVLVGIVCVIIFVIGFFVMKDFINLLYCFAAVIPIYFGFKMKKSAYALVSKDEILVFGLFGELKHLYKCVDDSVFIRKGNKIYIQNKGELTKLKLNNWFVNRDDWNEAMSLLN